eukprot:TRINITY_DN9044_c0_g1_i1.p3 TRINITY_DN9044_c0_g1~~TRINITY_DN9044_c0_g1_i1.p3  ORF type:complete len:173 (+),score=9.17 TRINITY_DN9044_c0_g1_i1:179-697(+)
MIVDKRSVESEREGTPTSRNERRPQPKPKPKPHLHHTKKNQQRSKLFHASDPPIHPIPPQPQPKKTLRKKEEETQNHPHHFFSFFCCLFAISPTHLLFFICSRRSFSSSPVRFVMTALAPCALLLSRPFSHTPEGAPSRLCLRQPPLPTVEVAAPVAPLRWLFWHAENKPSE